MGNEEYLQTSEEKRIEKLTLFLVDKQPIFRQGLCQALSPYENVEIVGGCSPDADTWNLIENASPDMVLVDIGSVPVNGFGVVRQIAIRCPRVAVIILDPQPDDDQLFQAIKSGAVAFLSKDIDADDLVDVLRRVKRGEYPINDSLLSRPNSARQVLQLFQNYTLKDMESLMAPLSQREVEILKYVAEGNPNKGIAVALDISEQTVKNHITSIMRKLNANDRTHAVVLAMRNGWINLGEASSQPVEGEISASV